VTIIIGSPTSYTNAPLNYALVTFEDVTAAPGELKICKSQGVPTTGETPAVGSTYTFSVASVPGITFVDPQTVPFPTNPVLGTNGKPLTAPATFTVTVPAPTAAQPFQCAFVGVTLANGDFARALFPFDSSPVTTEINTGTPDFTQSVGLNATQPSVSDFVLENINVSTTLPASPTPPATTPNDYPGFNFFPQQGQSNSGVWLGSPYITTQAVQGPTTNVGNNTAFTGLNSTDSVTIGEGTTTEEDFFNVDPPLPAPIVTDPVVTGPVVTPPVVTPPVVTPPVTVTDPGSSTTGSSTTGSSTTGSSTTGSSTSGGSTSGTVTPSVVTPGSVSSTPSGVTTQVAANLPATKSLTAAQKKALLKLDEKTLTTIKSEITTAKKTVAKTKGKAHTAAVKKLAALTAQEKVLNFEISLLK
jgi:hypothetical protein